MSARNFLSSALAVAVLALHLHAQAPPIAHAPSVMPPDQVGQFPFAARMLAPHLVRRRGLCPLLRRPVLGLIITLGLRKG